MRSQEEGQKENEGEQAASSENGSFQKPGIFSRVVGFFIGSKEASTTETESSSEEQVEVKTENTESESEYHDAQEY